MPETIFTARASSTCTCIHSCAGVEIGVGVGVRVRGGAGITVGLGVGVRVEVGIIVGLALVLQFGCRFGSGLSVQIEAFGKNYSIFASRANSFCTCVRSSVR